ncbi:hypothetical protein SteCoe_33114 [Stentor coeruleus]|uniref:Protein kinase domain-containing protein n=1 Tax=Stentor coeruleus TaxID=5963 RepID=A0A1R2AXG7_9CILI|nr:hypothetical protein SteCoe_33114 [Stentor coeruleus]
MLKVGKYLIEQEIAKGSFGTIFKARNQESNQIVALKRIPIKDISDNQFHIVNNEIHLLSQIQEPNVLSFYEALKTKNNIYFVMEYCEGLDLSRYLEKHNNVPYKIVKKWARELVRTLNNLEKNQIMHRDIKPANLLLTSFDIENANIKIGDFGFARQVSNSMVQSILGTPLYMAPEIYNDTFYTYKADVWSLGVVFYELIYGVTPFEALSIEVLKAQQKAPINFPDDENAPEEVKSLISAMLTFDYNSRPSFEELLLFPFIQDPIESIVLMKQSFPKSKSQLDQSETLSKNEISEIISNCIQKKETIEKFLLLATSYQDSDESIFLLLLNHTFFLFLENIKSMEDLRQIYSNQTYFVSQINEKIDELKAFKDQEMTGLMKYGEEEKKKLLENNKNDSISNKIIEECMILKNSGGEVIYMLMLLEALMSFNPNCRSAYELYNELKSFSFFI